MNGTTVVVLGGSVPSMPLSLNLKPCALSIRRSFGACVDRDVSHTRRPRIHRSRAPQNSRVNAVHDCVYPMSLSCVHSSACRLSMGVPVRSRRCDVTTMARSRRFHRAEFLFLIYCDSSSITSASAGTSGNLRAS